MHVQGLGNYNHVSQCQYGTEFDMYFSEYNPEHHKNGKLDAEDKRLWVEALRSGDYPQTTGNLRDSGGFCCLGVKCEIDPRVINLGQASDKHYNYQYGTSGQSSVSAGTLPLRYAKLLGIDGKGSFYFTFTVFGKTYVRRASLIMLNDDKFTFDQIADVIEYFF